MVTEQNDKLNRMVKTLLDMSELQTVGRDDKIILDAIVEEVLADLEPLAVEKNIKLIGKCEDATMIGSDILIYRLVYNLVENAIKYNHPLGQVTVTAYQRNKHVYLSVEDTGSGIPKELRERVFEPFFPGPGEYGEVQGHVALLAPDIEPCGIFGAVEFPDIDPDMALGFRRGHYGGKVLPAAALLFCEEGPVLFPDVGAVYRYKSFECFHVRVSLFRHV